MMSSLNRSGGSFDTIVSKLKTRFPPMVSGEHALSELMSCTQETPESVMDYANRIQKPMHNLSNMDFQNRNQLGKYAFLKDLRQNVSQKLSWEYKTIEKAILAAKSWEARLRSWSNTDSASNSTDSLTKLREALSACNATTQKPVLEPSVDLLAEALVQKLGLAGKQNKFPPRNKAQ